MSQHQPYRNQTTRFCRTTSPLTNPARGRDAAPMLTDALLAWAHLTAILTWTVFLTSQTALLRPEWFNAAALARLARLDTIARGAIAAVLATGLAKLVWGAKSSWPMGQPLFWAKMALFAVMVAATWQAGRTLRVWQSRYAANATLPPGDEIDAVRRIIFRAAHLMVIVPLFAVMIARGLFAR